MELIYIASLYLTPPTERSWSVKETQAIVQTACRTVLRQTQMGGTVGLYLPTGCKPNPQPVGCRIECVGAARIAPEAD